MTLTDKKLAEIAAEAEVGTIYSDIAKAMQLAYQAGQADEREGRANTCEAEILAIGELGHVLKETEYNLACRDCAAAIRQRSGG